MKTKHTLPISMELITVRFRNGESVTMNHMEAMWFGKDGGIVGHSTLEDFRDFCHERLLDARHDEHQGEEE